MDPAAVCGAAVRSMGINEVARGSLRGQHRPLSGAAWKAAVVGVAGCCAAFLLALPRVVPAEVPPALRLPATAVAAALEASRRRASQPLGTSGRQLLKLDLELGHAEQQRRATRHLRHRLAKHAARLQRDGETYMLLRVRARMAARLVAAVQGRLPLEEARRVLGGLPLILKRYDATREGELRAPLFVARSLYAARWNVVHGLPPTFRFRDVTRLAYHGWLALHGRNAAPSLRLQALQRYRRLGGRHAAQAAAVLHARAGRWEEALRHMRDAERGQPSLRLRNHRLALETATRM